MKTRLTRRNWITLAGAAFGASAFALRRGLAASEPSAIADLAMEAHRLIERKVTSTEIAAAALLVRRDSFEFARAYGKATIDTPFLIASPTKPMTVSAVLWLRDHGEL